MCEVASAVQRRHVGNLPAFGFFWLTRGVPRRLLPVKSGSRASNSEISVYHADFHEGRGTVGEWQGHGMECANERGRGTAWERRGMCKLALRLPVIIL
jgi:hypothetical protein